MKLEMVANISLGLVLSRVQANPNIGGIQYPLFTVQELAYELGQYNTTIEKQTVEVDPDKVDKKLVAQQGDIIIGLTSSNKAIVVEKNHAGKLIPSNFACIRVDSKKLNAYYLAWYFNEHPDIHKQLMIAMQGTSVRALSVQMLRELTILVPSMDMQYKIGRVYQLAKLKNKLNFEQTVLKEQLFNQIVFNNLKEDN